MSQERRKEERGEKTPPPVHDREISDRRREPTPLHRPKYISHAFAAPRSTRDGTVHGLHISRRDIVPQLHVPVARGFIDRHAIFDETASDIVGWVGEGVSRLSPPCQDKWIGTARGSLSLSSYLPHMML